MFLLSLHISISLFDNSVSKYEACNSEPNLKMSEYFKIFNFTLTSLKLLVLLINFSTRVILYIVESCVKMKSNLNSYFHISSWCLRMFDEVLEVSQKKRENTNLS